MVRRIPDLNPKTPLRPRDAVRHLGFQAFFTTTPPELADTVTAEKIHRGHAIIEQFHADLKSSVLAHLPSGKFNANAAWLVLAVMAFNLTRAAATLTGPGFAKATTATIGTKLIPVPARVASSARRVTLHLGALALADRLERPVQPSLRTTSRTDDLTAPADTGTTSNLERPGNEARPTTTPTRPKTPASMTATAQRRLIGGSRLKGRALRRTAVGRRAGAQREASDRRHGHIVGVAVC